MLIDYLHEHYDDGEPIFTEDIHIPGMNRSNFIQQLKTLTDNGKIVRYEKGIYYIPKETRFRSSAGPSPETIAQYKYICRNGIVSGYYTGCTFANNLGISLQVPMKKEITTNNYAAIVREVHIGKQPFIIRRSNILITEENVHVLQLLDLLKNLNSYMDCNHEEARDRIKKYAHANHVTIKGIDQYIREYPDSTFRFYYEIGMNQILSKG